MAFPDWVLKHKAKSNEVRRRGDKYYIYKISSRWDPITKKSKKVTGEYLGSVTEEYGLIPSGMHKRGVIPKGESPFKLPLKEQTDFLDHFDSIEDPRSERNALYSVSEILLVTLCAVICGAEGWADVENYGKHKLEHLRSYLDYANGTPSDDTIRRFYRSIDPSVFEKLFRDWVEKLAKKSDVKVIAIDGKSSRHSFDTNSSMLHIVSAFATEARIVLGQEKVMEKSNEITAIPKILDWLDVKGHIITIDAMGCQYKIADKILSKEGDYIFSLKGNQGNLAEDVTQHFEHYNSQIKNVYTENDKGHGRIETRTCSIIEDVAWLKADHKHWNSIQSIIRIESTREMGDKKTVERRYYISSLNTSAEKMLKAIRSHWGIENSLHWILDMSFNEDYSRIRKGNAPHVMAILRHVATNLLQSAKLRNNSLERKSIKGLRKICGWDTEILDSIIAK
jgi:predicted transposase YbfD/YdcC